MTNDPRSNIQPPIDGADAYEPVRRLIADGAVDLVTFDVFDTLVWRPVAEPDHLFVELGRRLAERGWLPGHVSALDFCTARRRAEHRARVRNHRDHPGYECTLTDIWHEMPATLIGDRNRAELMETELDIERSELRLHHAACDLITLAHSAGLRAVLVSDTYFTAPQLWSLLDEAGVPLAAVERVVASCDERLAKYDGLLRRVIADCFVSPDRAVHIGDNPIADIAAATKLGAAAVRADTERYTPAVTDAVAGYSARSGGDMGITALVRTTLLAAGHDGERADYQFGVGVGGPLMHGFARWVAARTEELDVDTIHCLLREGGVFADLLEMVAPDGPRAQRVHASRWVDMRAAVISATPDELFRALARKARFRAEHVVDAFGVDRRIVEGLVGTGPIDDAHRVEAIELIAGHDELRSAIIDASARLRCRLVRYLDSVLSPTDGRIVVCDIGWGGTIQEGLRDILLHEQRIGDPSDLIGLYLMLSPAGVERRAGGQRLESYLPARSTEDPPLTVIARNPELLEQLCTPDEGTLLDIDDDGRPITADHDPTMTSSRMTAQRGLYDAVRTLASFDDRSRNADSEHGAPRKSHGDGWLDPDLRSALLDGVATTLQAPHAELAYTLSGWLHDDIAGGAVVPLAQTGALGYLSFVNAAEISAIDMRDVFWLPGAAAAVNPVLAEQLAAVRVGADAERLCPSSPAGRVSIAVFAPGSEEAAALSHPDTRTGANGWSYIRFAATVDAVRDVRIDFGDVDHLVELDHLQIEFSRDPESGEPSRWQIDRADDSRLHWVDGRVLGSSRAAVAAGGFALVSLRSTADPEYSSRSVEIRCAFRATPLRADDAPGLLRPTVTERARQRVDRVRRILHRH